MEQEKLTERATVASGGWKEKKQPMMDLQGYSRGHFGRLQILDLVMRHWDRTSESPVEVSDEVKRFLTGASNYLRGRLS